MMPGEPASVAITWSGTIAVGAMSMTAVPSSSARPTSMSAMLIPALPSRVPTVPMTPELYGYRGQRFCAPGDVILGGTFAFTPAEADQRAIYAHYKQRRLEKQPQGYCCGSVFKNPEGGHAGALIEACGLKGTRRGGAILSPMHANFIMNENNARFQDVLDLIALAKGKVAETHGVVLEEEVRIIS